MTSANRPRNQRRQNAGPPTGARPEDVTLTVGYIVAAQGIRGEVRMRFATDRPEELTQLDHVYFNDDPSPTALKSIRLRGDGRHAILSLDGITDRNQAEELRGTVVRVRGDQLPPLDEGVFYHYQVIGLTAYTEDDQELGEVTDIISAGEADVYVVTDASGDQQLFPALPDVVLDIDPTAGKMIVRPQVWED